MNKDLTMEYIIFILFGAFIITSIWYIEQQKISNFDIQCNSNYCYEASN